MLGSLLTGAAYAVMPRRAFRLAKARFDIAIILGAIREFQFNLTLAVQRTGWLPPRLGADLRHEKRLTLTIRPWHSGGTLNEENQSY